nr:hypothetical protein [Tanacetum cinerariifolium]
MNLRVEMQLDMGELRTELGMSIRGGNAAGYIEAQNRVGNVNQGQARPGQARIVKCYNYNGTGHIAQNCTQPKRPQNSEYFKDNMLLMQAQENEVVLDAEQLLFLADVDEAPTAQTMFMANLSSVDPISDKAGPSYDLDILSEVQDHDQYLDDYMSVGNMIPYDHYVKDNEIQVRALKKKNYRSYLKPFLTNSKEKPNLISLSKMYDHEEKTINEENAHPKVVPQITTVTNISAKFLYLKKGEGNSAKSMTTNKDGYLECHKEEGLDKGYDKMQKILSQMNTLKIKPKTEDVNMKFLKGLPPSWSGITLILKTKGGLEYISFDDLYNKLKFLEINTKGYSSSPSTLSNDAFVSTARSSQENLSYQESENVDLDQMNKEEFEEYDLKHQLAMLSIKVHRFEKKHGRKIKFNGRENARFDKKLVK